MWTTISDVLADTGLDTGSFEFPDTNYGDSMRGMSDRIYLWQYSSGGYGPDYGAQAERIDMNRLYRSFT